ncbi:uncharacterized protein LOC142541981 [Primulina tabacum]|uniref:uncharacterized protein LOC142541981 n=1 Tax=Primulina tabacum TaxID=48773 RepID=UPI003F5979F9
MEHYRAQLIIGELEYNPKFEKTSKRLRKEARLQGKQPPPSSSPGLNVALESTDTEGESDLDLNIEKSESDEELMAEPAQRTLRELANPNVIQQPLCIQLPTTEANFELNSGLIHLLPTLRGLAGEDPHKHLKEFHIVCTTMKPQGITEEQISLRAFPFSLADKAKDWLYYLPSGTITTWDNMKQQFLEKFFPASRAANIRKDICGIRQLQGETLYEYWERFKKLCASFPQQQIPEQLLVQYFYEGLSHFDRNMIDAASGGALVNKTPQEARALISNMAANAQQFGTRQDNTPRQVNEVSANPIDQKLDFLTSLLEKLAVGQDGKITRISAIGIKEVNMDIHDKIITNIHHLRKPLTQETRASIHNLSTQVGQLATAIHKLETQNLGNLPSQTVVNQRENVSAITLRNCKELDVQEIGVQAPAKQKEDNEIKVDDKIINQNDAPKGKFSPPFEYKTIPTFPLAFNRKCESIKELNDTLRRGERNKLKGCEREKVGEHVSAVIQKTIPIKCSDPGMFSIPCIIGDTRLERAMLDLGASINVMPDSVYNYLELGPLTETDIVIQLADRSTVYPRGVIEDVLVKR